MSNQEHAETWGLPMREVLVLVLILFKERERSLISLLSHFSSHIQDLTLMSLLPASLPSCSGKEKLTLNE